MNGKIEKIKSDILNKTVNDIEFYEVSAGYSIGHNEVKSLCIKSIVIDNVKYNISSIGSVNFIKQK